MNEETEKKAPIKQQNTETQSPEPEKIESPRNAAEDGAAPSVEPEVKTKESNQEQSAVLIFGEDTTVYPLRDAKEDPRWAVRTVWIWFGFLVISLIFILTLLVISAIYD